MMFLVNSSGENAPSRELKNIQDMMNDIKRNHEIGDKYMHTWDREYHIRQEGLAQGLSEGIAQGLSEGLAQGLSQGLSQGRILAIQKLLQKSCDDEFILSLDYTESEIEEAREGMLNLEHQHI